MPTKPAQGGSAGTWGTELNAFLDVALNTDGTLKSTGGGGGGSSAPLPCDYLFTTDGTTITRYDRTGAVSATGTDIGALINGVASNYISLWFASGVFPWTTKINVTSLVSLSLVGQGGRQDDGVGGAAGGVGDRSGTQFKWTGGAASGQAASILGIHGLTIRSIGFQWTSSLYTSGDGTKDADAFFSIAGVDHSTATRHAVIEDCYFGPTSTGRLDNAGPVLDINKQVGLAIRDTIFVGGTCHLRSHHTNASDDFCNVVNIASCVFSHNKTSAWPSFYGSGKSWVFRACYWEPGSNGQQWTHQTVIENFEGLSFENCWWGDQTNSAHTQTAHIYWHGVGLRIVGGHIDLGNDYSIVRFNGSASCVTISGLHVDNKDSTTHGIIDCQDFDVVDITYENATYPTTATIINGNVFQPPRTNQVPYQALIANTTLKQSDHNRVFGVNATTGAMTITLPNADAVGCRLTIKKTDVSANSVTVQRAGSDTIEGGTTYALATQYKFVTLVSTGNIWLITGSN